MREILGRRLQRLRDRFQSLRPDPGRSGDTSTLLDAALVCATTWQWPVVPGVGRSGADGKRCACPDPDCAVPGAHPFDPGLLAATTDPRMVAWWWTNRPAAPVLMATGGTAPCAVSLPAGAAARALVRLDAQGMRLGPVVATPTRWALLVAPYSLERLGELLYAKDHVPSSLRFHGEGGYLLLPPSAASSGGGQVRWEREPRAQTAQAQQLRGRSARSPQAPAGSLWLPEIEAVVDALVEASSGASGGGSRLAY
ncbi:MULTISPECIES: bifunctional DNA primase/polymerase [Streptomyces]|uniref:bifunctional DNA primase/polymerase n=1 Tax=Streptomyces TaxID=1883 RepID=UPI00207A527D|nr:MULTISPECIES: bifunctional DNA primase/polymerase [Streptomyces]MCM9080519.1 bifunctional DNA primase/polymerase [Streptomyces spororaveus]MCX5305051.1 bifunctional DNA primase/polymerase [Streptomyces sp. NBC_00160]